MMTFLQACAAELRSRVSVVCWTLLTFFVVVSGPFGSYHSMQISQRVLIFVPTFFLLMIFCTLIRQSVALWVLPRKPRLAMIATAVVAAQGLPPLVLHMVGASSGHLDLLHLAPVELSVLILGVFLAQWALTTQLEQGLSSDHSAGASRKLLPEHRLLQRIEPEQRGAVLAISVRDHYVDVQTRRGTVSLLLRFRDAIAELDPLAGVQVHRSYWVAWEAIEAVEREGVKLYLKLTHGARVPVSKNHRYKLEARGLI